MGLDGLPEILPLTTSPIPEECFCIGAGAGVHLQKKPRAELGTGGPQGPRGRGILA